MRCARSIACSSAVGFHHTSDNSTWFAHVKFTPRPAAFRDIKITVTSGLASNSDRARSRAARLIVPSSRRNLISAARRHGSSRSSMAVHCENTIAFSAAGTACFWDPPEPPSACACDRDPPRWCAPPGAHTGASGGSAAASAASLLRMPRLSCVPFATAAAAAAPPGENFWVCAFPLEVALAFAAATTALCFSRSAVR